MALDCRSMAKHNPAGALP